MISPWPGPRLVPSASLSPAPLGPGTKPMVLEHPCVRPVIIIWLILSVRELSFEKDGLHSSISGDGWNIFPPSYLFPFYPFNLFPHGFMGPGAYPISSGNSLTRFHGRSL